MQSLLVHGIGLHHRWIYNGQNLPTIAFSNSLGTDFRIWDGVTERLGTRYNFLLYDKRGHGLSDLGSSPIAMADLVGDLEALLDHYDLRNTILCGLSVGGIISIGLAARNPGRVRALLLCNTAPKVGTAESWAERIAAVNGGGIEGIAGMVLSRWFTPAFRTEDNATYRLARTMLLRQSRRGYAETCAAIGATDFRGEARKLDIPALCIAGDQDQATPPAIVEDMAEMIPKSSYRLIAGCGHIPCMERPGELAQMIDDFISGL